MNSQKIDEFLKVSYTLSPLLVGLAYHGLCIKFGWLAWLARPIDAGATMRGHPLFGPNKTYRGVIAVGLGSAGGVGFQVLLHHIGVARAAELLNYTDHVVVGVGFALGMCAMLSELPNSVLKRQFGVAPGAAGSGIVGAFFYVLDQIDMLVGVWFVLWLAVGITASRVLWSVVFLFTTHQLLTVVGYWLGMRATVR